MSESLYQQAEGHIFQQFSCQQRQAEVAECKPEQKRHTNSQEEDSHYSNWRHFSLMIMY